LQVTFWINDKIPSPLERGEGKGEGLKKPAPLTPALSPRGGRGRLLGGPSCPLSRSGILDAQTIKVLVTIESLAKISMSVILRERSDRRI
jgi:hypothetical protein